MAQMVKNLPAVGLTPGSGGSPPWRRELLTNQVFLPGTFHDRGAWWAYSPWGCKESDTTEQSIAAVMLFIEHLR